MNIDIVLKRISDYQRPVRQVIWVIVLVTVLFMIAFGHIIDDKSGLGQTIIIGMLADMGIYTVAKTVEKNKIVDASSGPAQPPTINNIKTNQLNQS